MFVIEREREFWWPVRLQVPVDDKHVEKQFRVKLKLMSRPRFAAWLDAVGEANEEGAFADRLMEVATGWDQLQGEDGKPPEFNRENLVALLEIPYVPAAVVAAIRDAFTPPAAERRRLGN